MDWLADLEKRNSAISWLSTAALGRDLPAYIGRYPDDRLSVAVLCNRAGARAGYIAKRVADLCSECCAAPHTVVGLNPAVLSFYAGDYRLEDRFTIKVSVASDRLETTWLGETIALIPDLKLSFSNKIRIARFGSSKTAMAKSRR